jgi:hypothetical protein
MQHKLLHCFHAGERPLFIWKIWSRTNVVGPGLLQWLNNKELLSQLCSHQSSVHIHLISRFIARAHHYTHTNRAVMETEATKHFARTANCPIYYLHLFIVMWRWTRYCFFSGRTFALFRIWSESSGCLDAPTEREVHFLCKSHTFSSRCKMVCDRPAGRRRLKFAAGGAHAVISMRERAMRTFRVFTSTPHWPIVSSSLSENWGARAREKIASAAALSATPAVSTGRRVLRRVEIATTHWCNKAGFWFNSFWVAKKFSCMRRVQVGDRIMRSLAGEELKNRFGFKCVTYQRLWFHVLCGHFFVNVLPEITYHQQESYLDLLVGFLLKLQFIFLRGWWNRLAAENIEN